VDNVGADMGAFLTQMTRMERKGISYQAILKMHTKTNPNWRERLVKLLCGIPEQVRSILTQLDEQQQAKTIVNLDESSSLHSIRQQHVRDAALRFEFLGKHRYESSTTTELIWNSAFMFE
jgi:hypothetical protein